MLIYLSHENFINEKSIVAECRSDRVDGVLISVSSETTHGDHIRKLQKENIPVVFFDREFEGISAPKVIANDFEYVYISTVHLIKNRCKNPVSLSISSCLRICKKRADSFIAAFRKEKRAMLKPR